MPEPLRILHAVVNMNRGGAETLLMNLYRNIDRSEIQFDFLTCKTGCYDEEIRSLGGEIYRIPYISDIGHFKYIKSLNDFFSNHNDYKIVHSHMDKMSGFVLRAAKKAGIPARIAHSHNTESEGNFLTKSYKWYAGTYIPTHASHYIACSNQASDWLYRKKSSQSMILNNGIDPSRFQYNKKIECEIRTELDINFKSFVVGHVGRFCKQKNHAFLIEVFYQILLICPNAFLILAGDGPLRSLIEKRVKELGIESHVRFLGVREDINKILQAMDVFLFPSFHEGLPVSLIEAQAAHVRCLISDAISKEVDIGANLINYESIHRSPKVWALRALLLMEKKEETQRIQSKGFDIKISTLQLEELYKRI